MSKKQSWSKYKKKKNPTHIFSSMGLLNPWPDATKRSFHTVTSFVVRTITLWIWLQLVSMVSNKKNKNTSELVWKSEVNDNTRAGNLQDIKKRNDKITRQKSELELTTEYRCLADKSTASPVLQQHVRIKGDRKCIRHWTRLRSGAVSEEAERVLPSLINAHYLCLSEDLWVWLLREMLKLTPVKCWHTFFFVEM